MRDQKITEFFRASLRIILVLCFICHSMDVFPQFYLTGQDPAGLAWKEINTEGYRIVFPSEITDDAIRLANLLVHTRDCHRYDLFHRPGKIPVLMHNHSVRSNGFVAWAPKRMELVTTPPPDAYPDPWLNQLALHEYRHAVQVDKLDQGITGVMKWILGEQALGAVAGLMPFWYLEGDAVYAETRFSHSGRGRLPSFRMRIREILAEKEPFYSYEKAYYGSYRDFVPDYYQYGYQMVRYVRTHYGDSIWPGVIDYTARKPFLLYPFNFGLRKETGLSKRDLYRKTMKEMQERIRDSCRQDINPQNRLMHETPPVYTNYRFPSYLDNGTVFAEKSGIGQIGEFVMTGKNRSEHVIHIPGFYDDVNIATGGNRIVWTEFRNDLRWEKRSYSELMVYDMVRMKSIRLSRETRYFSPDITRTGRKIVVVRYAADNRYSLVILDAGSGSILKEINTPGNALPQYPAWSPDGTKIYLTLMNMEGKTIQAYDLKNEKWDRLYDAGFQEVAELESGEDFLLFRGTFSGTDNIYGIRLADHALCRVTHSASGAFYPCLSANGQKILYSEYTSKGFRVRESDFNPVKAKKSTSPPGIQFPYASEEKDIYIDSIRMIPDKEHKVEDYSRLKDLFRFHSWAPFYFDYDDPDIEDTQIAPGLSLLSQNLLETMVAALGYEYRDGDHLFHTDFRYMGFFPVLSFSLTAGGRPSVFSFRDEPLPSETRPELSLKSRIYVPLDLTSGKFVTGMRPEIQLSHNRSYLYDQNQGAYRSGLQLMDYRYYFYSYLKTSHRSILPNLGIILNVRHVNSPFEKENLGSQFSLRTRVYLPGITDHHTTRLELGFQDQKPENYLMNNHLEMPRGHDRKIAENLKTFSGDYVFPVAYPDFEINTLLYIKRLRGRMFYDYAHAENMYLYRNGQWTVQDKDMHSAGAELTVDVHLMHLLFPINTGLRYVYVPDKNRPVFQFVFNIDLNQF